MQLQFSIAFLGFLCLAAMPLEAQTETALTLTPSLVSDSESSTQSIEIRWLAKEGSEYVVQARSSLADEWSIVASGLKSNGEEILLYSEPALASAQFFQLLESPLDPTLPPIQVPDFHAGRIFPNRANLTPGQSIRFHATFDDGGPIDWFLTPSVSDLHGAVSDTGQYTAPLFQPDPPFIFIIAVNRTHPDQRATASILISPPDENQLTREQAVEILISNVIDTLDNKEDVIAFGLQKPLSVLDRVRAFDRDPNASQTRLPNPCWFFMVDEAPFSNWAHPALFVAVNCRTGQIESRERENWYPLINGLPVYHRSTDRLNSPDRVFIGGSAQTVIQDQGSPDARIAMRPLSDIEDEDIPPIPRMFPALPSACECPDGPRKYALIGVMNPEEPRLQQSGRDMKKVFESPVGGRFDEVRLFSDSGSTRLQEEFKRLRSVVRPCDVLVLMLLGHGGNGGVGAAKPGDVIAPLERIATTSRYFILEACDAEAMITQFENSRNTTPHTTILTASGTATRWPGTNKFVPLVGQSPLLTTFAGVGIGDRSGFTDALLACFSRYETLPEVHECLTSVTEIGPFALRIAASGPILKTVGSDDSDLDGILDRREEKRGLDPMNPDSDGDGICDGLEYGKLSLEEVLLLNIPDEFSFSEEPNKVMDIGAPDHLPDAVAPGNFEYQFTIIGGIPHNDDPPSADNPFGFGPMTGWTLTAGSILPEGLTLNRSSGMLAGIPIEPGHYEFDIQYMDAIGAKTHKTFQLEVRHPGTEGARILVTTGEDGNVRDDNITLREAVMIMSGQLSLADLRPDPDPSDRLPEGERRFVTQGLPGRESKDLVEWATGLFADGLFLDGPVLMDADHDRIYATNVAIHVAAGPAFEIIGNNNQLENAVNIIAASGPALMISGNGNIIGTGSNKTNRTFSEIEGAGQSDPGIVITGRSNRIQGPSLSGSGTGVLLKEGASNNTLKVVRCVSGGLGVHLTDYAHHNRLEDCLIGWQFDRSRNHVISPNQDDGVLIDNGAYQNTLAGCWIGANVGAGMRIAGAGTFGNKLEETDIGSTQGRESRAGEVGPNEGGGLIVEAGAMGNIVDGGIYSDNTGHGIWVRGEQTVGNRIGYGENHTLLINKPGSGNGIHVSDGAKRNIFSFKVEVCGGHAIAMVGQGTEENMVTHHIRKSTAGTGIVYRAEIEHTQFDAIFIGQAAQRNVIRDTRIRHCPTGIKIEGSGVRENHILEVAVSQCYSDGIVLSGGATGNIIGPGVSSDGNDGSGMVIKGEATRENHIKDNSSMVFTVNKRYAIEIIEGSSENVVSNNRVNKHSLGGIRLDGLNTEGNILNGNTFRGSLFSADAADTGFGIELTGGASHNQVLDNTCSNNGKAGIGLRDAVTRWNILDGNYLGSNLGAGVWIDRAADNLIGLVSGKGNNINGNALAGVHISGVEAQGNRVQRNLIGSSFSANLDHGILLSDGARNNRIGGARIIIRDESTPVVLFRPQVSQRGAGNVISGNQGDGIHLSGAHDNKVFDNLIGFSDSQPNEATNLGNGIYMGDGASNNCVGNCPPFPARDWQFGNYIIGNALFGIELTGPETKSNRMQGNWIFPQGAERIHISENANGDASAPQFDLNPVTAEVRGVASTPGFVEVFSDLDEDKAVYHFTAFVGQGAFVIRQLDPAASVNATIVANERPLRIHSTQMIQFTPSYSGESTPYQIVFR